MFSEMYLHVVGKILFLFYHFEQTSTDNFYSRIRLFFMEFSKLTDQL